MPLSLSFSIIFVFNYFISQLDKGIETEEALSLLKRNLLKGKAATKEKDKAALKKLLGEDDSSGDLRRRRPTDVEEEEEGGDTDMEELPADLEQKISDYKKTKASTGAKGSNMLPEQIVEEICKKKSKAL